MIRGKVAAILGPLEIVINRGEEHGIVADMFFALLASAIRIEDPVTNEHLGDLQQIRSTFRVTRVQEKMCVAVIWDLASYPTPHGSVKVGDAVVQIADGKP